MKVAQKYASTYPQKIVGVINTLKLQFWVDIVNLDGFGEEVSRAAKGIVEASGHDVAVLLLSVDATNPKKQRTILSVAISDSLSSILDAGKWASHVSAILGGKGGGKSSVAQGQGSSIDRTLDAMQAAKDFVSAALDLLPE